MKALASSSSSSDRTAQYAGAHSGLTHPLGGTPVPPLSVGSGEVSAEVLRCVCQWCVPPRVIREGVEPTTHGICGPCTEILMAGIRARKAARS